ncbi:MAG TPA: Mur ligase family protein [Geminicoccus sp.]|jgi:UDP-N-acetylmuramoyl-tripeptide--D-alanyl-D-alanine ligase|uniref:Mur ligase family protein n=1 Tax=Geminicoccus sp. TaxID=2024832 RepID=UPI002E37B0BA|nr:Mur ligase family protein [Geminicoccus sp.]HEX2529589.1 Mur ligase family protein [Geminicoccus sp.]
MQAPIFLNKFRKLRHLASAEGRQHLWHGARNHLWPQLRPTAGLHRRTFARHAVVIAVVGSYGKTSTVAAVCTALGLPVPVRARSAYASLALKLLSIWPWHRHVVFEVAIDGPGQMAPYAAMLRPDIVVVTSIGSEHHRSLGTLDNTRQEKGRMVEALRSGGVAVLNRDDPHVMAMTVPAGVRVLTYGFDPSADIRASEMTIDWPRGTKLVLQAAGTTREMRLRLLGRVMVYPALAAVAVAVAQDRPLDEAVAALEQLPPRQGRLQLEPLPDGAWLIRDDFKSSVETIHAALDVLADLPGRRIVVIGSVSEPPGSQGPIYREWGRRLAQVASRVVVIGPMFQRYAAGATAAGMPRSSLIEAKHSIRAAWEAVQADLQPGDVVLVKGRDTERLDRIGLALKGRQVRCELDFCDLRGVRCAACPKLETGWAIRV